MRRTLVVAIMLVAGCGSSVDPNTDPSVEGTSSATGDPTTTGGPLGSEGTSPGEDTGSTVTTSESTGSSGGSSGDTTTEGSGSSSSGDPLDGPGCAPPPACDRGEFVGTFRVTSSDQIDAIAGYSTITGSLEVLESDLECLDFLGCLEGVGRQVHVSGNPQLRSLRGTDAITDLGFSTAEKPRSQQEGTVVVTDNALLIDVDGFNGLREIPKLLSIDRNPALERITGLRDLVRVRDTLNIGFNPQLTSLEGLYTVEQIDEECIITNNETLCISETYAVCGDLVEPPRRGGNTQHNRVGC